MGDIAGADELDWLVSTAAVAATVVDADASAADTATGISLTAGPVFFAVLPPPSGHPASTGGAPTQFFVN